MEFSEDCEKLIAFIKNFYDKDCYVKCDIKSYKRRECVDYETIIIFFDRKTNDPQAKIVLSYRVPGDIYIWGGVYNQWREYTTFTFKEYSEILLSIGPLLK